MAKIKETINIGVEVEPHLLRLCWSFDLTRILEATNDKAALEFLTLCLEYAGFNYRFTCVVNDVDRFTRNNTITLDMLSRVQGGELDTVSYLPSYSEARALLYDYSILFQDSPYAFLIRTRDMIPSEGTLLLLRGLNLEVWLAWLLTGLLLTIAFTFVKIIVEWRERNKSIVKSLGEKFWHIWGYGFGQIENEVFLKKGIVSSSILFLMLAFLTVIMINMYQTVVFNQIISTAESPPFRSTEDLVSEIKSGRLKLVSDNYKSVYFDHVQSSTLDHFKLMRQALRSNPTIFVASWTEALELVRSRDGYVFVTRLEYAKRAAASYCHLTVIHFEMPAIMSGYVFNKNKSHVLKPLNKAILKALGRFDYLKLHQLVAQPRNQTCENDMLGVHSLSLSTLYGLFLLYVVAVGLALLYFFGEKISFMARSCNKIESSYERNDKSLKSGSLKNKEPGRKDLHVCACACGKRFSALRRL